MIRLFTALLRILPWLFTVGLLTWILFEDKISSSVVHGSKEVQNTTILNRIEQMGMLELVRYNFQEVTEVKKIADYIDLKIFKYKPVPDAKAVLISQGSAIGCIDLTRLQSSDILEKSDTVFVSLPAPQLCHFKIDLEKSRLYDLQISYMNDVDQKQFIQELYKVAEAEIRETALKTGLLQQTKESAELVLKPILQSLSGKSVIITFQIDSALGEKDF